MVVVRLEAALEACEVDHFERVSPEDQEVVPGVVQVAALPPEVPFQVLKEEPGVYIDLIKMEEDLLEVGREVVLVASFVEFVAEACRVLFLGVVVVIVLAVIACKKINV